MGDRYFVAINALALVFVTSFFLLLGSFVYMTWQFYVLQRPANDTWTGLYAGSLCICLFCAAASDNLHNRRLKVNQEGMRVRA